MRGFARTAQSRLMIELASRLLGPWVRTVDGPTLRIDAVAGLLGALLVLPQGFAFATLAGLPPEYGLATAIVPCVVAALFGSSLHVVSGPTNMISLALFATLAPLALVGSPAYIQLALGVTLLVGLMQWLIGALRLGGSRQLHLAGGAARLHQRRRGPDRPAQPAEPARHPQRKHRIAALLPALFAHLPQLSIPTVAVAAFEIAATLILRRAWPSVPQMLIALVAATALATALNRWWPGATNPGGAVAVLGTCPRSGRASSGRPSTPPGCPTSWASPSP